MQTFASSFRPRLKLLGVIAVYAGCPTFFFLLPLFSGRSHATPTILSCLAVVLPVFFLPVLFSLIGLIDTCDQYEINEDGIIKRRSGRETRLRWQDLKSYELSESKNTLTLTDNLEQKLRVVFGSRVTEYGFRDADGKSLVDALNERLLPLQAQMQQQARQGQTYRHAFKSPAGMLGVVMPIVFLLMAAFIRYISTLQPDSSGDKTAVAGLSGFFVFGALFFLITGLPILLSAWTVTDTAITRSLPWRTVTIPFDHIQVFALRSSNKGAEWVTLQGDGKKIVFSSLLPNYALLLEFVRARVPADALNAQAGAKAEIERQEARKMAWQMPLVGLMPGFLLALMGWMFLQTGQERLENYRLLAAQGQTTIAQVTDTHTKGQSNPRYLVDYTLDIGGKHYDGSSYVPYQEYKRAQTSGHIAVVYLPKNPDIKHATASLGNAQNVETIQTGRMILGVACGLPFAFGLLSWVAYKRKYTTPAAMRRLEQMQED